MLNQDVMEEAARIIAAQRLSMAPVEPPEASRPATEEEGYALQAAVNRRLAAELGAPVGHKIGCTTRVMQAFVGIHSPCSGEIFTSTVLRSGARLSRGAHRRLGVECEIVVELSRDIAPGERPLDRQAVADAVGAVMAGIETVDDRYRDFHALGAPTLIADNFFNAGCVLGERVREWRRLDLARLTGRMLINGAEVGRGDGAMVLGHPLEALAWLASSRAARGLGLRRGDFVFLGSLVETKWLEAGDEVRIEIEALGALDLTVAP